MDHFCNLCFVFVMLSRLVHCSLVVTCWERANLLALLCVTFSCVFVIFPFVVLGQVWCLIVSIPDLCLPSYLLWFPPNWICLHYHDPIATHCMYRDECILIMLLHSLIQVFLGAHILFYLRRLSEGRSSNGSTPSARLSSVRPQHFGVPRLCNL